MKTKTLTIFDYAAKRFIDLYLDGNGWNDNFYIYNKITRKYIEKIVKIHDMLIHSPALFTFDDNPYKNPKTNLVFKNNIDDEVRSYEELQRICDQILLIAVFDHSTNYKTFEVQYNIKPEIFKQNSYIEYLENEDNTSNEDIIRSACQLYNIFPGKKFYIYDLENSIYLNMKITKNNNIQLKPLEFIYENNTIKVINQDFPLDNEAYTKYILNPFRSIYEDFFINKTGATKYKLIRSDLIDNNTIRRYSFINLVNEIVEDPIEPILRKNNIEIDESNPNDIYYTNFILISNKEEILISITNKEEYSISPIEEPGIDFCRFSYSKKSGLQVISYHMIDEIVLKKLECMIRNNVFIPTDSKSWINAKLKSKDYKPKFVTLDILV